MKLPEVGAFGAESSSVELAKNPNFLDWLCPFLKLLSFRNKFDATRKTQNLSIRFLKISCELFYRPILSPNGNQACFATREINRTNRNEKNRGERDTHFYLVMGTKLKGCVCYIFASLFFKFKRENL